MGRTLIIKGADFSKVAIEQALIDGKFNLSKENYYKKDRRYIKFDGTWGTGLEGDSSLYYLVKKNQSVTFKPNGKNVCHIALVKSTASSDNKIYFANGTTGSYAFSKSDSQTTIRVTEDCLLYVQNISDGLDCFPEIGFIDNNPVVAKQILTEENYDRIGAQYITAEGTWGGDTQNPKGILMYQVYSGGKLHVKANAESFAIVAFLKYKRNYSSPNTILVQEQHRILIEAGMVNDSIVVPDNCLLWVYNKDGKPEVEKNIFPAELTITNENIA